MQKHFIEQWWIYSFENSPYMSFVIDRHINIIEQNNLSEGKTLQSLLTPSSFQSMIHLVEVGIKDVANVRVELQQQGTMDMKIMSIAPYWLIQLKPIQNKTTLTESLYRKAKIGNIIAEVTHGISNPLAIIQGRVELMKAKYTTDQKLSHQLEIVYSQCNRLFSLLQALQSIIVSHMPQSNPIDLNLIIAQITSNIAHRFFRIEFLSQTTSFLYSDEKVLFVLIERFCYFLLRINDQKLSLRLSLLDSNHLSFELISGQIDDNNISFMKEALGQKTKGSLGFDLMLVSIVMQDLNIKLIDLTNAGFTLQFPQDHIHRPPMLSQTKLNIAVVDDNRFLRTTLQSLLAHDGHMIQAFETAEQAWDSVISNNFDAIILDYNLPQMNGEEMWRHLTEKHPLIARRVILTTGGAYIHPPNVCFLPKPFSKDQLLQAIQSVQTNSSQTE